MTAGKGQPTAGGSSVMYVYGVAHASRTHKSALPWIDGIVPEAPVRLLVDGNLMAFVSAVPAAQFGADQFRAALKDAEWLKTRILRHEKVLEELRSHHDVVPFRFGTVYPDSAHIANVLARHRIDLCKAIDRVEGASEWGVKLYCNSDVLRRRVEVESHSIHHLQNMLDQASPGARFFLQKKYAKMLDNEIAATVASSVDRIGRHLGRWACESVDVEVQPAAVHGRSADMVMNAAYLVGERSLAQFRQAIAALRKEYAARGFDHELTGPWPPYHFVSIRQEGAIDAAASDR